MQQVTTENSVNASTVAPSAHSRPAPRQKSKPQKRLLDVHEFELLKAKNNGTNMVFHTKDGRIFGTVVNFDKFSVVVKQKNSSKNLVIFKHSMSSFTESDLNVA